MHMTMSEVQTASPAMEAAARNHGDIVSNDENNIEHMYLTFGVGGEEYGIGIAHVTEIVGMQRIMEVPDVPPYVRGVINLRGKIIPVMDLRKRFSMPSAVDNERAVIIVLDMSGIPIGLLVDNVSDVLEIPAANMDPPPPSGSGKGGKSLLRGLGKFGERVAIILDIERMVASDLAEIRSGKRS